MKKQKRIVFLGSDGSGKTSLIRHTKRELEKEGKSVNVFVMGWKDFHNPLLRFFSRIYLKGKENKKEKGERLDRFRARGWLFYFIYYSELWLRYFNVLLSKADYVLMDRYFYDELMFSRGSKYKFFRLLTPRPDVCLILRVPIDVVRERDKLKVSEDKLENFYNQLYRAESLCKVVRVDNSKPIKGVYSDIRPSLN